MSHIDLLEGGIEILQQENTKLCNGAVERRAKKKEKTASAFYSISSYY